MVIVCAKTLNDKNLIDTLHLSSTNLPKKNDDWFIITYFDRNDSFSKNYGILWIQLAHNLPESFRSAASRSSASLRSGTHG